MIDLAPKYLAEVQAILGRYLPGLQVWVYGSRASGTADAGSDLDLVVRSNDGSPVDLILTKEAFRESNLPITVELLDWATIPEHFRQEITKYYQVIQ